MSRQASALLTGGDPDIRREDPEPALGELLGDPVLMLLMKGDGVRRTELLHIVEAARARLGLNVAPAALAECGPP